MMSRVPSHFTFGRDGNAGPLLGDGWSFPEAGFTWTVGKRSHFRLPVTRGLNGATILELTLHGFTVPGALPSQRLSVCANNILLGEEEISEPVTIAFYLRPEMVGQNALHLVLDHPDAASPAAHNLNGDVRELAIAVSAARLWYVTLEPRACMVDAHAVTAASESFRNVAIRAACGYAPADLVTRFESLGQNCEFGLVQRRVDAEPLGLLRFAGLDLPALLRGLETAFAGVDDPDHFDITTGRTHGRMEYMARACLHGVRFHTNVFVDCEKNTDMARAKTVPYLRFLQRHFLETLIAGERIFVLQNSAVTTMLQALPVLARLCAYGPNTLLYITCDDGAPSGTVRRDGANLYRGFIDRFVPPDEPWRIDMDGWLSVCANTLRLKAE